ICLFTIGLLPLFYYIMICWGILGGLEHIAIQLVIPEMRSNVKVIYWVLKDRKEQKTRLYILLLIMPISGYPFWDL
ncbi:MAG: hypothetical protein PHT63_06120, partial [Bacteroidales bacterium]|nr:hypothetical protein [Bacteroidales bacterium]